MPRTKKKTVRDEIVDGLLLMQADRLLTLIPEIVKADYAPGEAYPAVSLRPSAEWQPAQELSIMYGETMPMIYESQAFIGQAEFVHGFTRGVATVGSVLGPDGQNVLVRSMDKIIPGIAIGDDLLPPIAPWLVEEHLHSVAFILKHTDTVNVVNMLAWSYGIWFAAMVVIGPYPSDDGTALLGWLRGVIAYFGQLGVPPA